MTKRSGWVGWLYSHGVGLAYGVIISIVLAIAGLILFGIVLLGHWWEKIR